MPDYIADFYSFLFQISMVYLVPQRAAIRAATECVVLKHAIFHSNLLK